MDIDRKAIETLSKNLDWLRERTAAFTWSGSGPEPSVDLMLDCTACETKNVQISLRGFEAYCALMGNPADMPCCHAALYLSRRH